MLEMILIVLRQQRKALRDAGFMDEAYLVDGAIMRLEARERSIKCAQSARSSTTTET